MRAPSDDPKPLPPSSPNSALMDKVLSHLGSLVVRHEAFRGDDTIEVARESILEAARILRETPELDFDFLMDLTAVDYFGQPDGFSIPHEPWDHPATPIRRVPPSRHRVNTPPRGRLPRFAVVYHLFSVKLVHRLRIKCRVPEEDPAISTVTTVWKGATWLERETYDMYGIRFTGHP